MTLFIVLHIFICFFLVFVILLQPGKGDGGIGFGSTTQNIFGSRSASNFLTKTTSICAFVFIFTSFFLARWRIVEFNKSVIDVNDHSSNIDTTSGSPGAGQATSKTPVGEPSPKPVTQSGAAKK